VGGSIRTARAAVQQGKTVFLYGTKSAKAVFSGSGARELADAGNETALLDAWNTGKESAPKQKELF
jgi:hypothetical protein